MGPQIGTIEAGKLANLTVVEGKSYFETEAKLREVWIDGRVYRAPAEEPKADTTEKPAKPASPEEGAPGKPKEEKKPIAEAPKETKKEEPPKTQKAAEEKKDK